MKRRAFLGSLGLVPAVARSYFDLGPSWQRHASGLIVPTQTIGYVTWVDDVTDQRLALDLPPLMYCNGEPVHCTIWGDGFVEAPRLNAAIARARRASFPASAPID
jgi:hypothetical protein